MKKQGVLTDLEWRFIHQHPIIGARILEPVGGIAGTGIPEMVLQHHMAYDGSGYPQGPKGASICLGARIIAVADSISAMLSNRPYRKAKGFEWAMDEIVQGAGTQDDPDVVDALVSSKKQVRRALVELNATIDLSGRFLWSPSGEVCSSTRSDNNGNELFEPRNSHPQRTDVSTYQFTEEKA